MAFENGVNWQPLEPENRGRHNTFDSAVAAAHGALAALLVEHNPFYDALANAWPQLFPRSAARPGRYEDGKIYLYVRSAPALFAMRMKLPHVRQKLATLPNAPKKIDLRLEIHAT